MGDLIDLGRFRRAERAAKALPPLAVWTCPCGGHEFMIHKGGALECMTCRSFIENMVCVRTDK